ncbi:MAG: histidine kinase [Lachnospiraceae bacterium]|nr:histidine kinase [Lachnospiraceae bacterium]
MILDYLMEVYYQYQTAIVIMVGLTTVFISNNTISKKKKNYLFKIIIFDFLLMVAESVNQIVITPEMGVVNLRIGLDVVGYVLRPMLVLYFYLLVNEKRKMNFNFLLVIPLIIDTIVCSSAFFGDFAFTYRIIDGKTTFVRGPLGFVPFAVSGCYILILIIDSIKFFSKGKEKTSFAVIYSAFIVVLGSILETIDSEKRIIVNFAMLSTLIYFLLLYFKTVMEQETEIVRQMRIEMMYSQIGPHFIFNTLSAIYGLVDKNPEKAKLAIEKFSEYLRGNIDSIGKAEPVDFEEELKHIDAYVWIEKMRFGDELTVEYELGTMDFKVPALSIQPLVENAIKHGIHKKAAAGKVCVKTGENEDAYFIEVTDDGVGFDTSEMEKDIMFEIENATDRGLGFKKRKLEKPDKKGGGRGHVGLSNIRSRLLSSGIGKMEIESEIGKGTKATVYIFK